MKKRRLLILLLSLTLTSCVVKESLIFYQDNSGKLTHEINLSKMMEFAGDKMGSDSGKKAKKKDNVSKDIDSIFSFKEIYAEKKDSISRLPLEEQARLKKMERYSGRLIMNEDQKKMEIQFFAEFKNPRELQDLVSPINGLSQMNPSASQMASEAPKNDGITSYSFDGRKFKKIVTLKPSDNIKEEFETIKKAVNEEAEIEEENSDGFTNELTGELSDSFKMLYSESSYEMTVSFPKKIKKVSISNSTISPDGKSVTIVFPMENYMESKDMNFEIELE
ncbi:MAG: hypothetical protein ABNG98_04995 [Flavobacterium sp.]|jgi:hypothetical protein